MFFSKLFESVKTPSVEYEMDLKPIKAIAVNGSVNVSVVTPKAKNTMKEFSAKCSLAQDNFLEHLDSVSCYFRIDASLKNKYEIVTCIGVEVYINDAEIVETLGDTEIRDSNKDLSLKECIDFIKTFSNKKSGDGKIITISTENAKALFAEILSDKPNKQERVHWGIVLNPDNTFQCFVTDTRWLEFSNPIKAKRGSELWELAKLMKENMQRLESGSWTICCRYETLMKKRYVNEFDIEFLNGSWYFDGIEAKLEIDVNKILFGAKTGYYVEAPDTEWDYTLRVVNSLSSRAFLELYTEEDGTEGLRLVSIGDENRKVRSGFETYKTNIEKGKGEESVKIVGFEISFMNYGLKYTNRLSISKSDGLPTCKPITMSDRFIVMPVVL